MDRSTSNFDNERSSLSDLHNVTSTSEPPKSTNIFRRPIIIPHVSNLESDRSRIVKNNKRVISETNIPPWYPRVLIIGPGGMKGMKALGFLSPVEDSKLLEYVDTYVGVSVGSLITLLMICGYHIREIVGEAVKLDIFKEPTSFDFGSAIEHRGFISNEPVRKRLTQLIINKFGNVPTLYGLYMMTGKSFSAITLNATDEECVMLNPFDNPDISCVDATMFSMNVPFIFYQLVFRGKTYVDGALANPYPIEYFDDGKTNILGIYMKAAHINKNVAQNSGVIVERVEENTTPLSMESYPLKIINALLDHRYYNIIQGASDKCKHVCLEVKMDDLLGYNTTTSASKAALLVEGFNQGKSFISQIMNNNYQSPKIPPKINYKYPPYFMMGEETVTDSIDESTDILDEMRINTH